jgi:hypothetical protein
MSSDFDLRRDGQKEVVPPEPVKVPIYEDSSQSPVARIVDLFRVLMEPLERTKTGPNAIVANTLLCLSAEAIMAYSELWKSGMSVPLSAFYTRNLLEILVWTRYCISSVDNATRFSQDAKRDVDGLLLTIKRLLQFISEAKVDLKDLEATIPDLANFLKLLDDKSSLDDKYKRVPDAASELGPGILVLYKTLNTILSKLLHPTSLMVNNIFYGENAKPLYSPLLTIGTHLTLDIIQELGAYNKTIAGA